MGKKTSGGHGTGTGEKEEKACRAFVLKVAMHCSCTGCVDKIRAAVKDVTLLQGIESWDQSALETKGELRLVATADPEKLRQRLHKATRKNVDLIFPKQASSNSTAKQEQADKQEAAAAALLSSLQSQYGGGGQSVWANHPLLAAGGGGYGSLGGGGYAAAAAQQAYHPWTLQQQQQPDPYAAYPYAAAGSYPGGGGGWGAYAYPPHLQAHQCHGYGGGAWHGAHGY